MEITEALQLIKNDLLPSINEYHKTGQLPQSLTIEKRMILKQVWEQHYQIGGSQLCIDCPGVIKSALNLIGAYYEREILNYPEIVSPESVQKTTKKRGFLK